MENIQPSFSGHLDEVQCRPCRTTYQTSGLTNPRRCPQCGGPTLTGSQLGGYKAATEESLVKLRRESARIMRLTGLGMASMQIMTYFFTDRQAATFFNDVVTTTATVAAIATEIWAFTASRTWMIIGSIFIQGHLWIGGIFWRGFWWSKKLFFDRLAQPQRGLTAVWHAL